MFSKLKQFKNLRDKAKVMQDTLARETVEGAGGWGKVKIAINGNQQVLSVTIDPSAMEDKTKLEGWIREAMNDAIQKMQKVMQTKLRDVGGLDIMKEFGEMTKK